jgi:hypothetical protein
LLIDLRQQIITLVAVFLALAVGIVLGSSMLSGGSVERNLSSRLDKDFKQIRNENQQQSVTITELRDKIRRQEQFDKTVAPVLVRGRLAKLAVAIVQTGDYPESVDHVKRILEDAGAQVCSTTVVYGGDDDADSRAALAVQSIDGETGLRDPMGRALQILANSLISGVNSKAVAELEAQGVIASTGDYSRPMKCIVLVGGSKESQSGEPNTIDSVLLDYLKAAGASDIVGVEPSDAVTSYIPTYRAEDISTIDNIDELMGQISLVCVLSGESGNFGVKATADNLFPEDLEDGAWAKKSVR